MTIRADVRVAKLDRIRLGAAPRALELCSGCGGLSLGMERAGMELLAHVEFDETAAASYALNFGPPKSADPGIWARSRDMTSTDPKTLAEEIGLAGDVVDHFDVLAAGLPCQAFARIGRSKLRSVSGDEEAFKNDPRARLYQRFIQYVEAVQPVAIIIENVPDILNFGGHNVPEEICETLEDLGYRVRYTLLNAAYYGVPQMRERLFLVAIDASLGIDPSFPSPTHSAKLPAGYQSARSAALKRVPATGSRFHPIPQPAPGLPPAVTARAALGDLPRITEHLTDPATIRRRKVADTLPYASYASLTPFARDMRNWPGRGRVIAGTNGHVVRLTPRDFPIFARMRVNGEYPHAWSVANAIFEETLAAQTSRPEADSEAWKAIKAASVPPYDPGKFPNKWWKLDPAMPSRTLTAHMGKDTYSHIHWDNRQKRSVSVREAARLQSFPDSFQFAGAMNAAFRQIGNAVPPLLGFAVASELRRNLRRKPVVEAVVRDEAA